MNSTAPYSEECSAIAFYGIDGSTEATEQFYYAMVQFFDELNYPPDKIGVSKPHRDGKLISFAKGAARLQKTGFEDVSALALISSTPDALNLHDYILTADWTAKYSHVVFVARSSIASLSSQQMLTIASKLATIATPQYGIGFKQDHHLGPEFYACGMGFSASVEVAVSKTSGPAYEEQLTICRWADAVDMRIWERGILRDVYPFNFLTGHHLRQSVEGATFEKWIRNDSSRGTLTLVTGRLQLWQVEERNIPDVRQVLQQAGLIFDWRKHL